MHLALRQDNLDEGSSPSFRAGRKLGDVAQALLWTLLQEDPQCPSRVLRTKVAERQLPIAVSIRHVNRWRARWQLKGRKGRPRPAPSHWPGASGTEIVQITPRLSCVGVHLFAHGVDQQETLGSVVAQLQPAVVASKHTYPGDDFALLHHREPTLRHRFAALFFAPLCGIDTLRGFDTREHPLPTLRGRSYHSSTLRQFLGQLERVDAAEALMPTLVPDKAGQIA